MVTVTGLQAARVLLELRALKMQDTKMSEHQNTQGRKIIAGHEIAKHENNISVG